MPLAHTRDKSTAPTNQKRDPSDLNYGTTLILKRQVPPFHYVVEQRRSVHRSGSEGSRVPSRSPNRTVASSSFLYTTFQEINTIPSTSSDKRHFFLSLFLVPMLM